TGIDVNTIYTGFNGVEYTWTVNDVSGTVTGESAGPAGGEDFANNIVQTLSHSETSS
ncbi:unnamed protein product, partial [marine sediment metagenome]